MAEINDIMLNLNSGYDQVTDLIPDKHVFVDDFDVAKNEYNSDFTLDETFAAPVFSQGNNGFVRDAVEQSDGKLVIVGHFIAANGTSVGKIARLNVNESLELESEDGLSLMTEEGQGIFSDCGISGVHSYSANDSGAYDLSPEPVKQVGEGSLDTAIVIVEGQRVSIQRDGYYELVDSNGNRKIVLVRDGESWDDAPVAPAATNNPNGHPTFGDNDNPTITQQTIPVGNPLAS